MLNFIFGRACSGKTWQVCQRIAHLKNNGKNCVLIVPEQYTLQSERQLLDMLGDSAADIPVYSFSRLLNTTSNLFGGSASPALTDSQKIIFMSRAIESVRSNLRFWQRCKATPEFCNQLVAAVSELKTCAIFIDQLNSVEKAIGSGRLSDKLHDLNLISNAFDALIEGKYIDPIDDMKRLYDILGKHSFFENKTVFFDSFKGFTGQQFMVIERILAQAEDCFFTFTTDGNISDDVGIFASVNKAASSINAMAKRLGVGVNEPIFAGEPRYSSNDIAALERYFAFSNKPECDAESIKLCVCDDVNQEAAYAATVIRNAVRTKGFRYRDFVVIARDSSMYSAAISAEFSKCDIPLFYDRRMPASAFPLLMLADRALKCVSSFSTDDILAYLKTGFSPLDDSEVALLENYVFVWQIEGSKWEHDWSMDPAGFERRENNDLCKIEADLKTINSLRRRALKPLYSLKHKMHGNAIDMGKALFEFIEECNAADILKQQVESLQASGESDLAELARMSWDALINVLDSVVSCMESNSLEEFINIWSCALASTTIGRIPQMLDEVVFGAADRIRPSRPKAVIVLGMNRGVFPASISSTGVFSTAERLKLINSGLPLHDQSIEAVQEESYLVYSSLCCGSDLLYVTCSAASGGEYERVPSSAFNDIINAFPTIKVQHYHELVLDSSFLPETSASAFARIAVLRENRGAFYESIVKAVSDAEINSNKLEMLTAGYDKSNFSISSNTAKRLFGDNINLSATRFDTYHRCPFSYFCNYGLRAKVIKPAEINVIQKGLIIHYVLEHLFNRFGKEIKNLSIDAITNEVAILIKQYIDSIFGIESIADPKFNFSLKKIEIITIEIVVHLAEEFKQSGFEPVSCELKIGCDGDVQPPEIKLSDGGEVFISGSVDRLDSSGCYIRVVDYKSGTKTFKLPDIAYGLNMQMLLYLYSIVRGKGSEYSGSVPAGVLYLPAKRSIGDNNAQRMNGIILDDEFVHSKMEPENEGRFVPKRDLDKEGNAKGDSFIKAEDFNTIFDYIERLIIDMGDSLHSGKIAVDPTDGCESDACKYCDFAVVCCASEQSHKHVEKISKEDVLNSLREVLSDGI